MVAKKRGLGRGLDALLPKREKAAPLKTGLEEIPIEFIQAGKYQPRTYFAEESIAELSDSIKAQGMIQPIVLRPIADDRYEIIAGERRYRAACLAGLETVPVLERKATDDERRVHESIRMPGNKDPPSRLWHLLHPSHLNPTEEQSHQELHHPNLVAPGDLHPAIVSAETG